jgi:hypothetical protein
MTSDMNPQELNERLTLIQDMIAEGRRTTQSWGWSFVLWGIAYFVAFGWAAWNHSNLAWPVTMVAAVLATWAVIWSRNQDRQKPDTTVSRAISSIWIAMGISMFVFLFSLGASGRFDYHILVAAVGAMLGMANATSSLILKWKAQFACALVWWASAIVACFGNQAQTTYAFLLATFLCQIVFGIYGMLSEARKRKLYGASHA